MVVQAYCSTSIFDETTLPAALRSACRVTFAPQYQGRSVGHSPGYRGQLRLAYLVPPSEILLDPEIPGLLLPEQPHFVEPLGLMKVQIDFYDQPSEG